MSRADIGRRRRTAIFRFNMGMLTVLAGSCAAGVLFGGGLI